MGREYGNMKEKYNTMERLTNTIAESKKKFVIESLVNSDLYIEYIKEISNKINQQAQEALSESDIAFAIDHELKIISDSILKPAGFDSYIPYKERTVKIKEEETEYHPIQSSKRKNGRIDSKINTVIIEYKHNKHYNTLNDIDKAANQAVSYLKALYQEEKDDYLAVVTDGIKCQFIKMNEGKIIIEPYQDFDYLALKRLIDSIIDLSLKVLSPENLIHDLTNMEWKEKSVVNELTEALYFSLQKMDSSTETLYLLWKDNFGLSHDDVSKQAAIEKRKKDLAEIIGARKIEADEEYKILFALQTAVAIIAILIAYKVVSVIKKNVIDYSLQGLYDLEYEVARNELENIVNGKKSHSIGIYNLLEIECFTWAFSEEQWNEDIHKAINKIIGILYKYENRPSLTKEPDDLFRDLYMAIIPTSVRHSLGEYYTKKWLAHNVNSDALQHLPLECHKHARVLDPAGGSGTFVLDFIQRKKEEYKEDELAVEHILAEISLIDANILAVILARINIFIALSDIIKSEEKFFIPAYIGDSTVSNSEKIAEDQRHYLQRIPTQDGDIELRIPINFLENKNQFVDVLRDVDVYMEYNAKDKLFARIQEMCSEQENDEVGNIVKTFEVLKNKGLLNISMLNSISNYFLLCGIGKFDLIVGNPPWVDWKNLPSVHRDKIKESCISRELFSGDKRTGGINLNVCALLSNISAENWLKDNGVMALLMPQCILFQQSYDGYRKLKLNTGSNLYFQEIVDWEKAGHPFSPVQQLFATYVISRREQDYFKGIPARKISIRKPFKVDDVAKSINDQNFDSYFETKRLILGQTTDKRTAFTYVENEEELHQFQNISGETEYIGREGVEYYPQELQLLKITNIDKKKQTVKIETYQNSRSKYSIPKRTADLEVKYLRPLIKGICVKRFHIQEPEFIVAFPYDSCNFKIPIPALELREQSRLLYDYYSTNRKYLDMQNQYSDKIINSDEAEYYALARTGKYSHAPWYVVFRDNTKWVSAVVGKIKTEWGGLKVPAFQNHCVSICENANGEFISEDEAHYICAILNSHIVERFILATSDKRTFKIRLPFKIKKYDEKNRNHVKLMELSKKAHVNYDQEREVEKIRNQIDKLYLKTLEE